MNVIFQHSFQAANGWRWLVQMHTADPAPLASPTVVTLPENCIINEGLEWACKFSDLPIGLTDTPTLKVSFNLASLSGSPALDHLRLRLQQPLLSEVVPSALIPAYSETVQIWNEDPNDPRASGWIDVTTNYPAQSIAPDIAEYKLTNFIILKCDKGESALAVQDFYYLFTGCQRPSPSAKLKNLQNKNFASITIEFFHSARFVLEQINATMLATYIRKKPSFYHSYAADVEFDNVPKKVQFLTQPKDVKETYAGMIFYKVFDFYGALDEVATEINKKVERKAISGVTIPVGGLGWAQLKAPVLSDFSAGSTVDTTQMYFIGSVLEPSDGKSRGGLLDAGSALYQRETIFDVLKECYEAGCIVRYDVFTYFHLDPMRGEYSGITLTSDDLQVTDEDRGAAVYRGVEIAAQNISNVRYTITGASFADKDWALKLFWHNATPESEGEKKEIDSADRVVSQKYNTTKLYALVGGNMVAVHPSCGFDNGASVLTTPSVSKSAPSDLTGVLRRDWKWGKAEYDYVVRGWTETTGLHTLVAQEILTLFGDYDQVKFPAKTARKEILAEVLPLSVGKVFSLGNGLFPWYCVQPTKAFLVSSTINIFAGTAELEFFSPKEGVL